MLRRAFFLSAALLGVSSCSAFSTSSTLSGGIKTFQPRKMAVRHHPMAIATRKSQQRLSMANLENDDDYGVAVVEDSPIQTKDNNWMATFYRNHRHILLTFFVAVAFFFSSLNPALAVSGGRMGGSFGSSGRSSSAPSRSYSSPSYNRGYSRGYNSGYYSRGPSVVYSPMISPFGGFGGWGYGYGSPGVIVSRGPSLFSILFVGGILWSVLSVLGSGGGGSSSLMSSDTATSVLGPGVSVVQLSVAMDVPRRDDPSSILSVLERLSDTARTDSRVGVQNLVSQVALEVLRQKRSIFAASSKYSHFNDVNKAQREFNNWAVKERGKFERETVSKFGGVDYASDSSNLLSPQERQMSQATVAVVTILLTIDGDSTKASQIRSADDVDAILTRIASDSKVDDCLQSAEILWTPEERSDTLGKREVFADYPQLRTI